MLSGVSPLEFEKIRIIGLTYQQLDYTKDEVFQYFGLLEKQKLIKRIKLKQLEYLDEERYTIVDNSLINLLADCWTLQSHVFTYLEYRWQSMSKPTNKEKIWFEHLWGKNRTNKWFRYCHNKRKDYQKKNKNQILKETQDKINYEKSEILNKFESIKKEHTKTINEYSYFIKPLLNVIYPEFLRND